MLHTPRHFWIVAIALTGLIFATIAPTLLWLEFSNSPEALNVATAMEIRRGDGSWLVPSLQGQTRLHKPPLTAWLTALAISDGTMRSISSTDSDARERGYLWLQWQSRWPALVAGCVLLLATASMGRTIAGPACGIASLIAAGSSLLFLRFSRYATTDIQLAMWVAIANALVFEALFHNRRWLGFVGAGIAVGLAFLSKGPVAIAQSVLPMLLWFIYAQRRHRQSDDLTVSKAWPRGPILAGCVAFVLVALPWFALVLYREPGAMSVWWSEITRQGATESKSSAWYSYVSFIPYLSPWFAFAIGGASIALLHRDRRELVPLFLLFVPIIVMSFAKDRNERYLLPLLPAAAILTGIGMTELLSLRAVTIVHWIILIVVAIGFPIAMMFTQPPWYPKSLSIAAAAIAALMIFTGIVLQQRINVSLVVTTFLVMLGLQGLFIAGYRNTREGSAELRSMADRVVQRYPSAEAYNAHPRGKRPPPELGVYLNRVVKWTDDPASLSPGVAPKVLFMLQDQGAPPPTPPVDWQTLEIKKRDKDFWWVFLLPEREQK